VKRSLESGVRPSGESGHRAQRFLDLNRFREGGRRLENNMVSVLCVFNRSFHKVKYLCKVVNAVLSRRI